VVVTIHSTPHGIVEGQSEDHGHSCLARHRANRLPPLLLGQVLDHLTADDNIVRPQRWHDFACVAKVGMVVDRLVYQPSIGRVYLDSVDSGPLTGVQLQTLPFAKMASAQQPPPPEPSANIENTVWIQASDQVKDHASIEE
jgi:hypothetical protein